MPHKGWRLIDVIDIREDGQSECETGYESCMMCGHEKIRFVHILTHDEVGEEFRVGCNCSIRMTDDYVNPELRERELRNRANRRLAWRRKVWRINEKGNLILRFDGHKLLIFKYKTTNKYKVVIDETFGNKLFDDILSAKNAAFKGVEYLKERGKW